ncbi:polysaccharide biosynthesis protein, partial [Paenibacillus thermoaerophilus]
MASMSKWARGAALLGLAALTVKLLGAVQKIPFQNLAGDAAFGLYSAVYPLYSILLVLATSGYPVAISKFVSEYTLAGDRQAARRTVRLAAACMAGAGVAGFALLYGGAETAASWIGSPAAASSIRAVSWSLLLMPWLAAIRGYEQGMGRMGASAASQVVEQTARVVFMVGSVIVLTARGADAQTLSAAALLGSAVGGACAMASLLPVWLRGRGELRTRRETAAAASGAAEAFAGGRRARGSAAVPLLKRFLAYALPVSFASAALPLVFLTDSFTLLHLLRDYGLTPEQSLASFGVYQRGVPLVQLIVMTAAAAGGALVPAIAQYASSGRTAEAERTAGTALRLALWGGLAAAAGLALISGSANMMLYGNGDGSGVMALMALSAWFAVLHAVSGSILQGFGDVAAPARSLAVASLLKLALNAALVPALGLAGASLALVAAYALAAAMQLAALRRRVPLRAAGRR